MQTKSSYRVMNWTLFAALATSLATACVVSSGDGNDNPTDIEDGGSSGSSTTKGGSAGTGGTKGGSGGSTSLGGTGGTDATGDGGDPPVAGAGGGGEEPYVAGLCQADDPTPTMIPSCDLKPGEDTSEDPDTICLVCLKTKCCTDLKDCYGTEPTTACGYGPTADNSLGQFDCIRNCVVENGADAIDNTANFEMCADSCLNQCEEVDSGLIMDDTNAILGCANDSCIAECFPVQ